MVGEPTKHRVLSSIGQGRTYSSAGRGRYRVGNAVLHVRYCSTDRKRPAFYKYYVNANSLNADYEVWICGESGWYLIPMSIIREIYEDKDAYVDHTYPDPQSGLGGASGGFGNVRGRLKAPQPAPTPRCCPAIVTEPQGRAPDNNEMQQTRSAMAGRRGPRC